MDNAVGANYKSILRSFKLINVSDEIVAQDILKAITEIIPKISAKISGSVMAINSRDNKIASLERKLNNVGQFVPEVTVDEVEAVVVDEKKVEEQKVDRIAQMKAAQEVEAVAQDAEIVAMSDGVPMDGEITREESPAEDSEGTDAVDPMVEGVPAGILEAPMEEITGVKVEEPEVKPAPAKKKSRAKKVKPLTEISI